MDIITIDFETYYDDIYSLSKLTTEEYIRSPKFEAIGLAVKVNNEETAWISGPTEDVKRYLKNNYDWGRCAVLAHNMKFDGAILTWIFDIHPRVFLDTLSMARALHGVEVSNSLKRLAEVYNIGEKGTEVVQAKGKRRADFSDHDLSAYGDYCINDTELCYTLFCIFMKRYPRKELKVIDLTLRMFIYPVFALNSPALHTHLDNCKRIKEKLLLESKVSKAELMSAPKFALLLTEYRVPVPMKTSLRTGKLTYAFAKTDPEFAALAEHPDIRVQAIHAARVGNKNTQEESRTERFIDIQERGLLPIPLKYCAAHTGRWGGDDKINLQNLTSRGANANVLKSCIVAPKGHSIIETDSAQIEARILAWLAGQDDILEAFRLGNDVYKRMAARIYGKDEKDVTPSERFVGKQTILGCISEGTPVLCESGWKPIEQVSMDDRLWDGEGWVCHQGLLTKGTKETLSLCGSWLTPDHKILCGKEWKEAHSVALDEAILSLALVRGRVNLPSQATSGGYGGVSSPLLFRAAATTLSTLWTYITLKHSNPHAVTHVPKKQRTQKGIGYMQKLCQMMHTAHGYLIGSPLRLAGVTPPHAGPINITVAEGYRYMPGGEKIGTVFSGIYRPYRGGITQSWIWIAQTTVKDMYRATLGLFRRQTTTKTDGMSPPCRRPLMTYDLAYAGPRNRFTIGTNRGPIIVHNCGYGMGAVKFQAQLLKLGVDMELDEVTRIINVYRSSNAKITALWKQASHVLDGMVKGEARKLGVRDILPVHAAKHSIEMPSGLMQRYDKLMQERGPKGPQYTYYTREGRIKIYGAKLIENICQAIARCVIAEQMVRISQRYRCVLTVHDSLVFVVEDSVVEAAVPYIAEGMQWIPAWAGGLALGCDMHVGKTYGDSVEWVKRGDEWEPK